MVIPEGERMMIQAFDGGVHDEKLREDMLGFVGQELLHADAHDEVMNEVFTRHGIDSEPFNRQIQYFFRNTLGRGDSDDSGANRQRLIERLGFSASAEHRFTFMGDWALNADLEKFGADPQMLDLFRWHGSEEVEHRAVAHEVAAYFGVEYVRRSVSMLVTWPVFLAWLTRGAIYLCRNDPNCPDIGWPRLLWELSRAMRRGLSSWAWSGLSTFVPGFHPDVAGSTSQALAYIAQSPAAKRAHA